MITIKGVVADLDYAMGTGISLVNGSINPAVEPVTSTTKVFSITQTDSSLGYLQIPIPTDAKDNAIRGRVYFHTNTSWASASYAVVTLRPSGSTQSLSATLSGSGQPGQMRLTQAGTALAQSPSNTLALNTWYRLEWAYVPADSAGRVEVFVMGSDVPLWSSGWHTNASFAQSTANVQIGRVGVSPPVTNWMFDEALILHDNIAGMTLADIPRIGRTGTLDPIASGGGGPVTSYIFDGDPDGVAFMSGVAITLQPGSMNLDLDPAGSLFEVTQSGSNTGFLQYVVPTVYTENAVRARTYFNMGSEWPSSAFGMITTKPTASLTGATATLSGAAQPGQVRLVVGGSTVVNSPQHTLALNQWYRLELAVSPHHGKARVALFSMGSSAALWTSDWQEHPSFYEPVVYVQFGRVTNSPAVSNFRFDNGRLEIDTNETTALEALPYLGRHLPLDPLPTFKAMLRVGNTITEIHNPAGRHRMRMLVDGVLKEPKVYLRAGSDLFHLNT